MNTKKLLANLIVLVLSLQIILTGFLVTIVVADKQSFEEISVPLVHISPASLELKQFLFIDSQVQTGGITEEYTFDSEILLVDSVESLNWGVDETDADLVWGITDHATDIDSNHIATGDGVKVAVIDVSFDTDHIDIDDNFAGGWDFVENDSDPNGIYAHGTHCAGIIAAEDNDVDDSVIGVAPEVDLYGLKVLLGGWDFDDEDTFKEPYNDIHSAIEWSINNSIDVISMSFSIPELTTGANYIDTEDLEDIINTAWNSGIVLITSAGNKNEDIGESIFSFPQSFTNVITVGAIDDDDTRYVSSSSVGSNYGDELDFVAPGVDIRSCTLYDPNDPEDDRWSTESGTSAAAPMVAGTCALMFEVQPTLTANQVREILIMTSETVGASEDDGHGKINASKAVDAAQLYFNDTDNDGLTDAEEKYKYFTDINDTDSDNDGLDDGDEVDIYETDPADNDSDNDSCEDGWEINYDYDPNDNTDGALDEDNDDLRNIDEHFVGTDPTDSDTDGDGIIDGDETFYNLDPLDDSDADDDNDNDGLTNIEEINGWYDLNDDDDYDDTGEKSVYQTNPNNADTDGDGWNDYREQYPLMGNPTDPTDPTDKPPFFP